MKNVLIASLMMLAGSMACAQTPPAAGDGGDGQHHRNPKIAAACAGNAVGTKVSVTFKDGQPHEVECGMHRHHREQEGDSGSGAQPQ